MIISARKYRKSINIVKASKISKRNSARLYAEKELTVSTSNAPRCGIRND
jgi:hypothetical protein